MTSADREAARERQSHVRHELRAPLSVMYPLVTVLLDGSAGELTAQQREYLQILERNVARLEGMIASAVDSGWLDCAAASVDLSAVSLAEVVEELLAVRRMGPAPSPRIDMRLGPGAEAVAWADRGRVRQIVANLLDNAVRFTPLAGSVRVVVAAGSGGGDASNDGAPAGADDAVARAPADADSVTVRVVDDGCGMSSAELEHVFEFGFRGAAAQAPGASGLGLGLWVCRELAASLGGSVDLESVAGESTCATLVLPAAAKRG
jgi:signal transduction histidine kinase